MLVNREKYECTIFTDKIIPPMTNQENSFLKKGPKIEIATWGEYVYIYYSNNCLTYKRYYFQTCYDLVEYLLIIIGSYKDSCNYCLLFDKIGNVASDCPDYNLITFNQTEYVLEKDIDNDDLLGNIPVKWTYINREDFKYPSEFQELFITLLLSLKKHKIPKLLIIMKIFELVLDEMRHKRLNMLLVK